MIGQILVNGTPFSSHRFPDGRLNYEEIKQALELMAFDEQLHQLGHVEIQIQNPNGLERLMAAIWGGDER
jgi:hypothetical protein